MGTLTNLNDVKRTLGLGTNVNGTMVYDDTNLDNALLSDIIQEASDFFSHETDNNYYGAQGTLILDSCHPNVSGRKLFFRSDVLRSITRIENDGNANDGTLTTTDWVTMPRQGDFIYGVELKSKSWTYSNGSPLGAIKVIGALGMNPDGQPSERVHLAVTRLASWLYQTRDTRGAIQIVDSTENTPTEMPNIVLQTIEKEKRNLFYI